MPLVIGRTEQKSPAALRWVHSKRNATRMKEQPWNPNTRKKPKVENWSCGMMVVASNSVVAQQHLEAAPTTWARGSRERGMKFISI